MKKIVSLMLALLLCVTVLAASLQAVGFAAKPEPELDPDPVPTVMQFPPRDPDGTNTLPPDVNVPATE